MRLYSNTQLKLFHRFHLPSFLALPLTHRIFATSIIPMHRSLTRFETRFKSRCTTTCGSRRLFPLTTRLCSSFVMLSTPMLLLPLLLHKLLDLLLQYPLLLLSQSFHPMTLLFQLSHLPLLPFPPPSLFRKIDSFLFLTVLLAHFALAGISCKSIYLNHSLLLLIAPQTVAITATSLAIILTILHFQTQLVAGGFYGIASPLPLLATSNLVNVSSSTQLLRPTPLPTSPGLMLSHSLIPLSASLGHCLSLNRLPTRLAVPLPFANSFLSISGNLLLPSASLAASFRLSSLHLLLPDPVGPALPVPLLNLAPFTHFRSQIRLLLSSVYLLLLLSVCCCCCWCAVARLLLVCYCLSAAGVLLPVLLVCSCRLLLVCSCLSAAATAVSVACPIAVCCCRRIRYFFIF